ncbi:MAG: hypothetical protein MZV64_60580 [Ignavibacteriales bacterium]|nr:hypothetical protein [Ignavibacteriales bacterium]
MIVWMLLTILFRLLLNFTRPVDYLDQASFDIVFIFLIYLISPARIQYTIVGVFFLRYCSTFLSSGSIRYIERDAIGAPQPTCWGGFPSCKCRPTAVNHSASVHRRKGRQGDGCLSCEH